jgi:hypothetical protein
MKTLDFHVEGDAGRAKATVTQALEARKFTVVWGSEWVATAERGSKVANMLLGALAQYFKVGVSVMTAPEGHGIIRIERSSSGWMGGAIGARRTTKNFEGLKAELEGAFASAGVLKHIFVA